MRHCVAYLVAVALVHGCLHCLLAQAVPIVVSVPTYNGFQLPKLAGSLRYALSASETVNEGYYGSDSKVSNTSLYGNLAYVSASQYNPFSMVYAGGYLANTSGAASSTFHNFSLSQVITLGRWSVIAADNVYYLPQSPTGGLSGLSGLGDLQLSPINVSSDSGQDLLTRYAKQVDNAVSTTLQRRFSGRDAISGSGNWMIQRFVGNTGTLGQDNDQYSGTGAYSHRISPLSSVSVSYTNARSFYINNPFTFSSQTFSGEYQKSWSRKLSTDVSVGPQYTSGDLPAQFNVAVNASLVYQAERWRGTASYLRTTNNGSGVTQAARTNTLQAAASRTLIGIWNVSGTVSYATTHSLVQTEFEALSAQTLVSGVQLNRQLGQSTSAYASYTVQHQTYDSASSLPGAFSGNSQIIGFGLTYAPRTRRFHE